MTNNPYAPPQIADSYLAAPPTTSFGQTEWTPSGLLEEGWQQAKKDFLVVLGSWLLGTALNMGFGNALSFAIAGRSTFTLSSEVGWPQYLTVMIIQQVFGAAMFAGQITVTMASARGQSPSLGLFFSGMNKFVPCLLATIVYFVAVFGGTLLLIVPGIIALIGLSQSFYFAVDRGCGPMEAARLSWRATQGQKGKMVLFGMLCMVALFLGGVACGVGLIAAVPAVYVASALLYLRLSARLEAETALMA